MLVVSWKLLVVILVVPWAAGDYAGGVGAAAVDYAGGVVG